MKNTLNFLVGICVLIPLVNYGQQNNDFKIGVQGLEYAYTENSGIISTSIHKTAPYNQFYSSAFGVLKNDGINFFRTSFPDLWISQTNYTNFITLVGNHSIALLDNNEGWFKASPGDPVTGELSPSTGLNVYDWSSLNSTRSIYNYDALYSNVYSNDYVYGHMISGESNHYHWIVQNHWPSDQPINDPTPQNIADYSLCEVPPLNLSDAFSYFSTKATPLNQKLFQVQAAHSSIIDDLTTDPEGTFKASEYLKIGNKGDVFLEGSYFAHVWDQWPNSNIPREFDYLGKFKSIDYAKNYYNKVFAEIDLEYRADFTTYMVHSNPNIPNGNNLWFQAYTSIIHGVKGLIFWGVDYSWNPTDNNDVTNKVNFRTNQNDYDNFNFVNYPEIYKKYVSNLTKELRYLKEKNLLSDNDNSIIYTKTTSNDDNCILPASTLYLPGTVSGLSAQDIYSFKNDPSTTQYSNYHRTEDFGIRYSIRTNGNEVIMIATNPNPYSVLDVPFNFNNITNPVIKSSTSVDVLFENNTNAITDLTYKINRDAIDRSTFSSNIDSNIDYISSTLLKYSKNYSSTSNKTLTLSFGPFDVHIIKFVSSPLPNHNNGWDLAWSNFGNGNIGGHMVGDDDLFYTGDFNGDGEDELLCIGKGGNTDWITLLKYKDGQWNWLWSNYGTTTAGDGIYDYRDNLFVGDFDGDVNNKDEVVGVVIGTSNSVAFFEFNGADWVKKWGTTKSAHDLKSYSDKIYVGDFDNDSKHELFGVKANGMSKMFKWNGSSTFTPSWSSTTNHAINSYVANMFSGDFDGGNKDLLLGFSGSWSVLFNYYNSDWNWTWSNNGNGAIGGIPLPFLSTDRILAGNIDSDTRDEFFYIQTHENASWAISHDFVANPNWNWSWNWSANPTPPVVPFIDDWALASNNPNSFTNYFLIKPIANEPSYLLAMRKYEWYDPCNDFIVNMYKPTQSNFKVINQELQTNKELGSTIATSSLSSSFKLYPNPSSGVIEIYSENSTISMVEIFDVRGQLVFSNSYGLENDVKVDISEKPNGIYFIKIISTNGLKVEKIIKN